MQPLSGIGYPAGTGPCRNGFSRPISGMLSYDTHHSSIMPDHPQAIISISLNFATRLRNQGKKKGASGVVLVDECRSRDLMLFLFVFFSNGAYS
jgi:hypothetical protein